MKAAENMKGLDLDGGWHIDEMVTNDEGTGGYSSVSYYVSNKEGKRAFLKVLDFSGALQDRDPTSRLEELTSAYNFERNLLQQCKDKKLRHIVVPVASGTAVVPGGFGALGNVPYLIFEEAKGDIRKIVITWEKFHLAWALRSLHHSAVGLQELHGIKIAHQDIKPSNILVFEKEVSKITDLGSASQVGTASQSDEKVVAGDVKYIAPEQWYSWGRPNEFLTRYLVDLYRLGSLVFFFFAACSATDALQLKLSVKYGREFVQSDFDSDLPYIQNAFGEVLSDLQITIERTAGDLTSEIINIVKGLCEPDPRHRGDTRVLAALHRPQYDLQPYISYFDRLAKKAEIRML